MSFFLKILNFGLSIAVMTSLLVVDFGTFAKAMDASPRIKVLQYLKGNRKHVILSKGKDHGITDGVLIKTIRFPKYRAAVVDQLSQVGIETGKLKVIEARQGFSVAQILSEESMLSKSMFPHYPGVMVGDLAMVEQPKILAKKIITPEISLSYFDLFSDPQQSPSSFELTEKGKKLLKSAAQSFAKAQLGLLMVAGYTDSNGSADSNQIESYQRALTIKQYLVDELGFDERRVEAIGFGEGEPFDKSMVVGYRRNNRRIILKALDYRESHF